MTMRRWIPGLVLAGLVLAGPPARAAGPCSIYRSWSDGQQLTGSDLTSSFLTVGKTNMVWSCLDGYSQDLALMRTTTDPFPSGTESLATTGAGELERLRFVLQKLTGWSQWYAYADSVSLPGAVTIPGSLTLTAPPGTGDITQPNNAAIRQKNNAGTGTIRLMTLGGGAAENIFIADGGQPVVMGMSTAGAAQLHVKSALAFRQGMIVDSQPGPTASLVRFLENGGDRFVFDPNSATIGAPLTMASIDTGAGNYGRYISLGRNTNASAGAGFLQLANRVGTTFNLWVDSTGALRYSTALPTNAGDLGGAVLSHAGVTVRDYGAKGDNATDDAVAFQNAVTAALNTTLRIPLATYRLGSNVTFADTKYWVTVDPGVSYSGAGRLVLDSLVPHQLTPVLSLDLISNSYNDSTAGNIFQRASHLVQTGTAPGVAVFGQALGSGANSSVWGGNFVGYSNNATASGRGVEVNYGVLVAGGTAYGVIIAASGANPVNRALSIQTNTPGAKATQGLYFPVIAGNSPLATTGTMFGSDAMTVASGLDLSNVTATVAAISVNNDAAIAGYNQARTNLRLIAKISTADDVVLGDTALNNLTAVMPFLIQGNFARPFRQSRSTTAVTAPGSGIGLLRWENGTNAGTLKLVGYSGTSTTGVTIIDNVGAGN